ncbi:hypothetical protein CAFE_11440 [Caprobacter fermentans]|uniref:Helix-turn-helix domain-containing protein n=1 Tax=Caproicibacter fermentans TaxID=2576756 RepID=A0A6N8HXX7_9FIRM|nr:hypothetical protein [Caproicibacter fermentans]MVB10455.1 hypothetical protein [Caproicibacter fermentans]OCN01024.1 hypothetical protein A7X67_01580 [Clostridium sp. W14A]
MNQNGKFRPRRVNFAAVSNTALQDVHLSLKSKGLYALIQSYIGKPNFDLYKKTLKDECKEGSKAFDAAWKELKETGYLKVYRIPKGMRNQYVYEFELLDIPDKSTSALITLNKNGEPIAPKDEATKEPEFKVSHLPQKGGDGEPEGSPDISEKTPDLEKKENRENVSHPPHFGLYGKSTLCEPDNMQNGGDLRNTEIRNTEIRKKESVGLSDQDGSTDFLHRKLEQQIEYDYFEENFPEDLPEVNILVDCMMDMLSAPTTRINQIPQERETLKRYIDNADAETVRDFLDHMRNQPTKGIRNVTAYWRSSFVNYLRDRELVKSAL